ncbi:uncharacterized protein Z518_04172 [Rhinocladiella mackenziei CBS 650.93]|uniref:C3H1-type domain-containing protein n=1 Tax=Rhinocladiella mackenziei CBS 650.93 TaxID=1442369 RepID=A0A0D2H713_9EURO|nr:uncharacterized protein Z518_04172 [Rhinocladiella mackenziei CBS 650.93]KIX06198.1 hypothetical protein Z518_04172 [Rhinocladiella mackenziei CBS 650.93]
MEKVIDEKRKIQEQLEISQYLCKKQVEDLKTAWQEVHSLQKSMNCDPFVLVLIDADITMFSDNYVQRGSAGGHDAARDLRKAIYEYFKTKDGFLLDTKIVIHMFANMAGLSKTYQESKILSDPMFLRQFLQGFNKEHALCHFIDAGDDKEAADKEMELFYNNAHCKHIMFAGSGDNSYAGFLRQYTLTDQICSRVVLVESVPFASKLEDLAAKFEKTRLQGLFRETKIETRRGSFREDATACSQKSSPPTSYASTVRQTGQSQAEVSPTLPKDLTTGNSQERKEGKKIFQNSLGQRVDQPVKADRAIVTSLKPKKLCNRHFLTRCNYAQCLHSHEGRLTPAQIEALRFIARLSPCQTLYCEDPDCVAGHRCMQGTRCDRRGSSCWFSEEMHNVDVNVTGFITV